MITGAPNFPKGRVFDGHRNRLWANESMAGIRVIRVWTYIAANEAFARRILDFVSYMVTATIAALFVRRVDIIVATSPQFFTAVAGWMVSVLKRRPWIFELRDIWPESIRAVGAMKEGIAVTLLEKLELFLYRRATSIVSVTEAFRNNLTGRGIDAGKIHVVTNGVDLTRFRRVPKDIELTARLNLTGKFVVGYIGTMGMAHALGTLLEAAAKLQEQGKSDVHFVLLGDGAEKAALVEQARSRGLENVMFLDTVPKDEIARYWSLLDASIIHLRSTALFQTVIPSKMFECMAMGIPILLGVKGEAAAILESCEAGLLFKPECDKSLVAGIRRLANDLSLRSTFSKNGSRAAQNFDRSVLAARLLRILRNTARGTREIEGHDE